MCTQKNGVPCIYILVYIFLIFYVVYVLIGYLYFSLIGGSDYKLIYRHYATLYFVFCVDSSESELGILDLIQVFVETLDKCFENVCELDLIFHVDKVSVFIFIFESEEIFLFPGGTQALQLFRDASESINGKVVLQMRLVLYSAHQ